MASTLYTRSPFAHGYIHGYESGFHSGDLDIQFGRSPRDPSALPGFKNATIEYQREFGSRTQFKIGYEDGFLAGYSDATHDYPFRAITELRVASRELAPVNARAAAEFDKGMLDGYQDGLGQGGQDGRDMASADPIPQPCFRHPQEYCDGFERGFHLGYDDAYSNQSPRRPATQSLQASADK